MNATAKDNRYAWLIAKSFLDSTNETLLTLDVGSEPPVCQYTIVKLPYGKSIYLLYAYSYGSMGIYPGATLTYSGFYCRENGQAYDIHEPLNRFFCFDSNIVYKDTLKKSFIEAIQQAVAAHIAGRAEEFSGLSAVDTGGDITGDAEKAFSKKETRLDFAQKITINDWFVSERNMADFIDDPDTVIKRKVEERIKGQEEELARLWVAHCTSQKLLDRLYAENTIHS